LGGVTATYGNSTGGRRGALIGSFVNGIMMAILPSLFLLFIDSGVSDTVVFGDSDYTIFGLLLETIFSFFR